MSNLIDHGEVANDEIYFSVIVDQQRAEFLAKMLEVPLCKGCGREEAECSGDPCQSVMADRGGYPRCAACGLYSLQIPLETLLCDSCRKSR